MDYKEKYENGLKCIQEILSGAGDSIKTSILRKRLQPFFPELKEKESEDERIRKAIIAYISQDQHFGVSNADMIAWLEKQSEQKPTENAKKLDANKVIKWLNDQACLGWLEDVEVEKVVEQFKKDFGL